MERLKNFYKNKRIFITGHTGFKGQWLTAILLKFNSKVTGFSLNDQKRNNMELIDICNWHTGRNVSCCPICRDSFIPKVNVEKSNIPLSLKTEHIFSYGKKIMLNKD